SESSPTEKEKLILSVARFELSGSKKQLELVKAFKTMCSAHPEITSGWKLVMVGGSSTGNQYLAQVQAAVAESACLIELMPDAPVDDVRDLYRRAAIFWHGCGLDETLPERVEHFGMTTVESMQNYVVPIVIDGGGQKEIVEHGVSGFRFSSLDELAGYTLDLLNDSHVLQYMATQAFERSQRFDHEVFKGAVEAILDAVEIQLVGKDKLPTLGCHETSSANTQ
ncbi:MAG: glycosyltransferase, partial [Halioglobus sp.]|nr:glycosyltransferase [Halioglobus sp.]